MVKMGSSEKIGMVTPVTQQYYYFDKQLKARLLNKRLLVNVEVRSINQSFAWTPDLSPQVTQYRQPKTDVPLASLVLPQ